MSENGGCEAEDATGFHKSPAASRLQRAKQPPHGSITHANFHRDLLQTAMMPQGMRPAATESTAGKVLRIPPL